METCEFGGNLRGMIKFPSLNEILCTTCALTFENLFNAKQFKINCGVERRTGNKKQPGNLLSSGPNLIHHIRPDTCLSINKSLIKKRNLLLVVLFVFGYNIESVVVPAPSFTFFFSAMLSCSFRFYNK